jgi:hypothetical protein
MHEGAAGLVRGAMMAIRNVVSHPGWPDPEDDEALAKGLGEQVPEV